MTDGSMSRAHERSPLGPHVHSQSAHLDDHQPRHWTDPRRELPQNRQQLLEDDEENGRMTGGLVMKYLVNKLKLNSESKLRGIINQGSLPHCAIDYCVGGKASRVSQVELEWGMKLFEAGGWRNFTLKLSKNEATRVKKAFLDCSKDRNPRQLKFKYGRYVLFTQ
ncbi:hypothetical protein Scep_021745 [Stephania cephalantha]|uniref:Uncharacterized protein n=1 Tax=Stephania cephalantha TaxID=152367 RepID=A0AAP0F409_9MAGN